MDHDDLIRLLDSGDKNQFNRALAIIVNQIKGQFFSWSRKNYGLKGLKDEEIEEVFVETIIVFDRKISAGGTKILTSAINAYIFGIGKIKWLEFFRKREVYEEFSDLLDAVLITLPDDDGPDDLKKREFEKLSNALYTLSSDCRQLLTLHYWEDLSYAEILELMPELGNANNCRQRKFYCLDKLKKILLPKKQK